MGICASQPYSAPCSRCVQSRMFPHVDARATLQDSREVEFFARYRLGEKPGMDARLLARSRGFHDVFPNDRMTPIYACDKCVKLANIPIDSWVYCKTGFLRYD